MLRTYGNVLTLLLTGPPSLSATNTTSSSCLPKKEYYSSLVSSDSDNPKRLWQTVNKLLHRKFSSPLPTTSRGNSHVDSFASFFHRQNIKTPSVCHQQPCYTISALTLSSCQSSGCYRSHVTPQCRASKTAGRQMPILHFTCTRYSCESQKIVTNSPDPAIF